MLFHFRTRIRYSPFDNPFSSVLNPIKLDQTHNFFQTLTLKMANQFTSKRPTCPSCSKPTRLCLCSRFQNRGLENSVAVTILQHSLERKHPLNSARIAKLGLKNLTVVSVFDVHFEARFLIRLLDSDTDVGSVDVLESSNSDQVLENVNGSNSGSGNMGFERFLKNPEEKSVEISDDCMECSLINEPNCVCHNVSESSNFEQGFENSNGSNSGSGNVGNLKFERFLEYPEEKISEITDNNVESSLINETNGVSNCRDQCENTGFAQNLGSATSDVLVLEPEHELISEERIGAEGAYGLESSQNNIVKQCNSDTVSASFMLNKAISDAKAEVINGEKLSQLDFDTFGAVPRGIEGHAISATIGKKGFNCSFSHYRMPQTQYEKPDFDQLLASPAAVEDLAKGFVVKKMQKRQLNRSVELEEYEEFELEIPPGSVLLFPSDNAVGIEDIDFEVKKLIVLDGTWSKAKRMYKENPWLKLLPHLKLDPKEMSLYGEVRVQPRPGCLSTIESIVYALKAVGQNPEGLDDLLDVFESMVIDQRRCKDERLSRTL